MKSKELIVDDEFKSLIPPLSDGEFNGLKESIINEGCRDALVIWDNIILDGHNRYKICMENDIIFKRVEKNFDSRDDAKVWIVRNQMGRRNLTDGWKYVLFKREKEILFEIGKKKLSESGKKGRAKQLGGLSDNDKGPDHNTQKILAGKLGWSTGKLAEIEYVEKESPETFEEVKTGDKSVHEAYKKVKKEIKNKEIKDKIDEQKKQIEQGLQEPDGLFDIIVVDPPWKYDRKYDADTSRVASKYPEMDFNELLTIDLHDAKDCILWLWTTDQFIWDAKNLLESWGFEYKAIMIWDKEKMGIGKYLRLQCEFCLLGIKGKPIWDKRDIRDIIREPRTKHSVKPESFYKMIDDNFVGRKLDYFGRRKRDGWSIYGAGQKTD